MKKIILLFAISLFAISGYSQFYVPVSLNGDCVYTQPGTFYRVNVKVFYGTTLMAEGQAVSLTTTSELLVEIPAFCMVDNIKIYKIVVDARKAYIDPYSLICRGNNSSSELVSCQELADGVNPQLVILQ